MGRRDVDIFGGQAAPVQQKKQATMKLKRQNNYCICLAIGSLLIPMVMVNRMPPRNGHYVLTADLDMGPLMKKNRKKRSQRHPGKRKQMAICCRSLPIRRKMRIRQTVGLWVRSMASIIRSLIYASAVKTANILAGRISGQRNSYHTDDSELGPD